MKTRRIVNGNIVWFGSCGATTDVTFEKKGLQVNGDNHWPFTYDNVDFIIKSIANESTMIIRVTESCSISLYGYRKDTNARSVIISTGISSEGGGTSIRHFYPTQHLEEYSYFILRIGFILTAKVNIIVNFKSNDNYAIFYNKNDLHDNYSDKQQSVVDSLTQKLSVLKGELWYMKSYGLPLFDKLKSKAILDAKVLEIVNSNPDVVAVENFNSSVQERTYSCNMDIKTIYGNIQMSI